MAWLAVDVAVDYVVSDSAHAVVLDKQLLCEAQVLSCLMHPLGSVWQLVILQPDQVSTE